MKNERPAHRSAAQSCGKGFFHFRRCAAFDTSHLQRGLYQSAQASRRRFSAVRCEGSAALRLSARATSCPHAHSQAQRQQASPSGLRRGNDVSAHLRIVAAARGDLRRASEKLFEAHRRRSERLSAAALVQVKFMNLQRVKSVHDVETMLTWDRSELAAKILRDESGQVALRREIKILESLLQSMRQPELFRSKLQLQPKNENENRNQTLV